ncbi:hypothetical protein AWM75_05710 [Aerococcus urinaehominis]|uniref:Transposase IS204/IS1001/IS1096/IS1165 DDE domain-containing protein n=2 Tax=Aerococcus urinaehominis TaxID=128944 RepID=A0A0X8FK72_9LACT|nr:ISL3 family transposase [Aerococcus urinaehominis]AMB98742.1 hypothetical protein AWM75_01455 [Aerococcus urinaehominis]AMB98831.1 hypothetical protein AWM75_01955 [Aerococcus urinaehominis]AMB99523.1 hypothetical protein AWM75_05710 [Aerococcus urinaehominis]
MAQNDCIKNLLSITDENIKLEDKVTIKKIKQVTHKVIYGTLTYQPDSCPNCLHKEADQASIIKHGYKLSRILIGEFNTQPISLVLKKQRFFCKNCQITFTASSNLVAKNCFISRQIKCLAIQELSESQSMSLIAKKLNISNSTVIRLLESTAKQFKQSYRQLPRHLSIDEFKSVKNVSGAMSCILVDAANHRLFDILEDRTQAYLRDYFMRFPLEKRKLVETITMDMYSPYYDFLQQIFPNAKIIIDRFHIVQLLNQTLNSQRILVMNQQPKQSTHYRKLKQLWKLILKNQEALNSVNYRTHRLFDGLITEAGIVEFMLNIDSKFRKVYDVVNELKYHLKTGNINAFLHTISRNKSQRLPKNLRKTMNTLLKYLPAIINSFRYTLSNGPIEGMNNKIKNIKRSGFGYRNFYHLRARAFLSFKSYEVKRENKPTINRKIEKLDTESRALCA